MTKPSSTTEIDFPLMVGGNTTRSYIVSRGKGLNRSATSRALGISDSTAKKMDIRFADRIEEIRQQRNEEALSKYKLDSGSRVGEISALARRILNELKNRDLGDVKAEKLVEMGMQLLGEVDRLTGNATEAKGEQEFAEIMNQINTQVNVTVQGSAA